MPGGADEPLDIGFHQQLQHCLGYDPQKVAVAGLLHGSVNANLSSVIGILLDSR